LLTDPRNMFERFNPAVLVLLLVSLVTYLFWKRARYFGNTAPLLIWAGLLYFAMVTPTALLASVWALPIVFVFVGGIWADLVETRHKLWLAGVLLLLLVENAYYCVTTVQGNL
jgi:ABC-type phosphate transport system permease subunit